MNLLLFSDTHWELSKYIDEINFENIDLLVFLWDNLIADFELLKQIPIRKIGILGNNDPSEGLSEKIDIFKHYDIEDIAFKRILIEGKSFFGIDGSVSYMLSETLPKTTTHPWVLKIQEKLEDFVNMESVDILISHFPCAWIMSGDNLMYRWLKSIRSFIEKNHPDYFFHWHMHNPEESELWNTKIIQVYPWKKIAL